MATCQITRACQSQTHTVVNLRNSSGQILSLYDKKIWEGSQTTKFPDIIDGNAPAFTHIGTPHSVVGLAYKGAANGIKWVVAWSNRKGEDNKVYTEIVGANGTIDWIQIKINLETLGKEEYSATAFGYLSEISIDPKGDTPTVNASIGRSSAVQLKGK